MRQGRREFLKVTAGAYTAGVLGTHLQAAQVAKRPDDLTGLSLKDASDLLDARKVSPVELTRACLARIERLNPSLNTFITVTGEQALADAKAAETLIAGGKRRGRLLGIPIALKDLFDTAGVRTTAGSALFAFRVPKRDAEVGRRP